METRIDDNDGFSILPLEVIGLVLKKLDEVNPVEELKKCKFISSRLYKATQDIFQDEFNQKMCTHFDGSKLNYSSSRSFGMNIFGSYKLNFPTIKISRAEYYLMKSWLEKLIPTNLQTLELKDNLLNWMEMVEVLAKFPKILKLKYIQSSDDMIVADKIYNMYNFEDQERRDFYKKMKELVRGKPEFLSNLQAFEAEVIHWNITNILSVFVAFSQCEKLEKFALKIDLFGISKSKQPLFYSSSSTRFPILKATRMKLLAYFNRFAKSMKSIEIIVDDSKLPLVETNFLKKSAFIRSTVYVFSESITSHFSKKELINFDQLESLVLKAPIFYGTDILYRQLRRFIRQQKNLENLEISYFEGQGQLQHLQGIYNDERKFLKRLVAIHRNHNNKKTRIGYQVDEGGTGGGMKNISQFSENLSALKVILVNHFTTWKFSDQNIPKFPNCIEMRIENYIHQNWDNYEFQSITEKFQNLEKLIVWSRLWEIGPKVFDQDFQQIITGLPHLRIIHIESSAILSDSALTGLTSEAIEARKENPSESIGPEDRTGLPISHLKNLESLVIISEGFMLEISDITAHHAFENMPKLKFLNLYYSNITREGFETISAKTGSKNLNILQLTTKQVLPNFDEDADPDVDII